MKIHLIVILVLAATAFGNPVALAEEQPGTLQSAELDTQVRVQMGYLLYLPKDYEKQDSWPLLLFLHGAGERGDDLELVKKHGPPKLIAEGKEFPFIVISPQCPQDRWWEPTELLALLTEVGRKYKVDADRTYVTGLSMGGFGTWRLAFFAPDQFAAIAPICGGGEKYWAKQISHLPVWAFHGANDAGVPPERSQMMVDEIKNSGGSPKLTVYSDTGHDSWTETYNNPELYKWLLKQKRVKSAHGDEWTPPGMPDLQVILQEARSDTDAKRFETALAKHVWFHENALSIDPAFSGVRLSFALSYWLELADQYPPALAKLRETRTRAEELVMKEATKGDRVFRPFQEMAAINRILRTESLTKECFEDLDSEHPQAARRVFPLAQPALIKEQAYSLFAKYVDPETDFSRMAEFFSHSKQMSEDPRFGARHLDFATKRFTNDATTLVAILAVNDRKAEAEQIADLAREEWDDPSFHKTLQQALDGTVPAPWP